MSCSPFFFRLFLGCLQLYSLCSYYVTRDLRSNLRPDFRIQDASYWQMDQVQEATNAWRKGFVDCQDEVCEIIADNLPNDLIGTYYRNGYGKFNIGKETIFHPFDSDGLVAAITFNNGTAFFRNRFVRTKGFLKERRSQRISYRGAFGTQITGGWLSNIFNLNVKNTANTNMLYWNDRLYALWEGGLPYALAPDSLDTLGESRFKGNLAPRQTFSAHPKIDTHTGNLISFSTQLGPETTFTIYEIDRSSKFIKSRKILVPGFSFAHDIGVTESYYLLFRYPMQFDALPFITGQKGSAQCINYLDDKPTELFIIPREPTQPVEKVILDGHFSFHIANAHETTPNKIIIDVVRADKMVLSKEQASSDPIWKTVNFDEVPTSKLTRYTISKVEEDWQHTRETLGHDYVDFPIVNPKQVAKELRYVFLNCGREINRTSPLQGILKYDLKTRTSSKWMGEIDEFLSEPVFASRKGSEAEDDGYILSISSKTGTLTNELCIFDAKDISKGPLRKIPLPAYLAYGLHGIFVPDLTFDTATAARKFKTYSIFNKKNWERIDNGFSFFGF